MSAINRRSALSALGMVGLACIAAKAATEPTGADANLIRVCDELMAIRADFDALFARRITIEDEHRTEPELTVLAGREREAEERLSDLPPPVTLAGAQAMARVALSRWPFVDEDGHCAEDFDAWLSLTVIEFLTNPAS